MVHTYAGAIRDTAWTTDKTVTTGVNSVTSVNLQVNQLVIHTLYNDGTVISGAIVIIKQ